MGRLRKAIFFTFVSSLIFIFGSCYSEVPEDGESAPKLSQIELSKPANKTIYQKGDALDTTGLEVTAIYRSGHTKVVSGWEIRGFDSSIDVGSQNLTVYYEENGVSRFTQYTIQYSNISGISISHPANKLIYAKGEELDITGLEITASYTNGKSQVVAITKDNVKGFDSSKDVTSQTLVVTYAEGDLSYSVQYQIQYSNLTGISISHPADKLIYSKGDELDITGLKITASYKNGMSQIVNVTKDNITGFDSSRDVTNQTLTVTYAEGDLSYSVQYQIQYSNLSGISVTTPPRKTKYRVGDYAGFDDYKNRDFINLDELVLTVSRTDGNSEIIDFSKIESDVLVKDENGRIMIEFLNDTMTGPCKNYYDIPKTKTIDLGNNRSLVFSGFAFVKEDTNPQINIEYTEDCNGEPLTRTASFGISVNYEPSYQFTEEPKKVDGQDAYYFGDYPQSEIKADEKVIVCKKSIDRGFFKYYVGSDGNYYVEEFGTYFKIEPILWRKHDSYGLKRGYIADVALDGNVIYSPLRGTSYLRDEQKTETVTEEGTEQGTEYYNYTTYYYTLHYHPGNYQKSLLSDFLNGTTASGLGTYSGKGFYQTAFTGKAQEYLAASAFKEQIAYDYVKIRTYTDGTKGYAVNGYGWTSFGSFSQMVALPDFCGEQDALNNNYVGYKKDASEYAKKKISVDSNGRCKYMIREIYSTDPNSWGYEMIQHSSDYVLYCDVDGEWGHYDDGVVHLKSEDVYNSYDLGIVPWIMFNSID